MTIIDFEAAKRTKPKRTKKRDPDAKRATQAAARASLVAQILQEGIAGMKPGESLSEAVEPAAFPVNVHPFAALAGGPWHKTHADRQVRAAGGAQYVAFAEAWAVAGAAAFSY